MDVDECERQFNFTYIDLHQSCRGSRGRMVVGFITTCAISAYHHENCEFTTS
jgi:hypothetical protein